MKKMNIAITAVLLLFGLLTSCSPYGIFVSINGNANENEGPSASTSLEEDFLDQHEDLHLFTLWDDVVVDNGTEEVLVGQYGSLCNFAVGDDDGNVYMLAREVVENHDRITIDATSTAIALVTMHPLFALATEDEYQQLKSMILSSACYADFYAEVEEAIQSGRPLYDGANDDLLVAISNLMEDLCGRADDGEYDGTLDDVDEPERSMIRAVTKSIYEHPQINPTYIDAQVNGNVLSLRTAWVTPSYYGTITMPSGEYIRSQIESRGDFGGMDLFFNRTTYGPPMEFTFGEYGNYKFSYSRTNSEATLDFYRRLAGSVLTMLNLNIKFAEHHGLADAVAEVMLNSIADVETNYILNGGMTGLDVLGLFVNGTVSLIESGKTGLSVKAVNICKIVGSGMNWYDRVKGVANTALRLGFAFDAPESINFCTCYSEGEVKTCSAASLTKLSGDEQTGYFGQRLLLPLKVYVETLGEDDDYYMPMGFNKVKFEVVSGGGAVEYDVVSTNINSEASTYWTLGESGEQKVKVTVLDIVTGNEISEPVYFTASLETASITVRLDWSKHSSNTDIDLHVVDPFGEEIFYQHMNSASGGYLDRDDTVGPGPEHVRWSNAPAGLYKIYVHYFPNNAPDKSITSYTVSVTAGGVTYAPKSGSIAYDQYVPVGQFRIGEETMAVRSVGALEQTDAVEKPVLPKK